MSDVRKMIRVTYTRHATGGWHLASMESSSGVRKLFTMPDFDPSSPDPKRQHISDLFDALKAAGLQGRKSMEDSKGQRHELVIYFGRMPSPSVKKISQQDDEDQEALKQLQAESRERLSTEEDSRRWLQICRERALVPNLLGSRKGPDEP